MPLRTYQSLELTVEAWIRTRISSCAGTGASTLRDPQDLRGAVAFAHGCLHAGHRAAASAPAVTPPATSASGAVSRTGLNPLAMSQTARTISWKKIGSAMGT